jgi:hypothetical protein
MSDLMKVIRREHPEVIHGQNLRVQSVVPIKRTSRSPLVLSLHDYSAICATHGFVGQNEPCSGPAPAKSIGCASGNYGRISPPVAIGTRTTRLIVSPTVDMFLPLGRRIANQRGRS